jgi:hypothetical protein
MPFPEPNQLYRLGRNQRAVSRALLAYGREFTKAELLRFIYPRLGQFRTWHWKAARQAAESCGMERVLPRRKPLGETLSRRPSKKAAVLVVPAAWCSKLRTNRRRLPLNIQLVLGRHVRCMSKPLPCKAN